VNAQGSFVPFGATHLITIFLLAFMGIVLVCGVRRWATTERARNIAVAIGVFMIVQEIFDRSCHHFLNGEPLRQVLPFHLCGMSVFLTAIMLITQSRWIYELVYFWGLIGASMAILTPDIQYTFPDIIYVTYFTSHALIVIGVFYMTLLFQYRPTVRSFLKALVLTNVYMFLVAPINLVLDTNYLFLRQKPEGSTLFNALGPWPWYILALEVVGTVLFAAVYAPWFIKDYIAGRRSGTTECIR